MLIEMINLTPLKTQKHYSTMLSVTVHIFKFNPTQTLQYINGLRPLSK